MVNSKKFNEIELKSLIEDIINGYITFINIDGLRDKIYENISKNYVKGLESTEIKFNMNFVPNYSTVSFIQKFSFDNVKNLEVELKDSLRKELSLGLMNHEGISQLKQRIKDVMDTFITRAEMIARTESVRAFNMGHYQGAKDSGRDLKKEWVAAESERTCETCNSLNGQIVEMDDKFKSKKGEDFYLPPAHPNCRCRVIYVN